MKYYSCTFLIVILILLKVCLAQPRVQRGKYYPDGHGGEVYFPLGDISFADEVVMFKKGNPAGPLKDSYPERALGIPDYDEEKDKNYVTLGCGGTLVLKFNDNVLIDVEGPDLYVFEIGPAIEPTRLFISKDGKNWQDIGNISGGKAAVDISTFAERSDVFHYVKLVDLKTACEGDWPGADIDAVGAIGSGVKFLFNTAVLFNFGKFQLKPQSQKVLREISQKIKEYPGALIIIEGHTDNVGTTSYNQLLSERRAKAVKHFLSLEEGLKDYEIISRGYGESRPISTNDTESGRKKNRRVEIMVLPR